MRPLRKKSTTTMMMTLNTTSLKPLRNMADSMPRKLPLSRPRSHHSEQAMNRKLAMQLPVTEPRPPRTTMSSIS